MYTNDSLIIIRRNGDKIQREDITTATVLMDGNLSAEQNRNNTVERLRQDPTVLFVLEPRNGLCEETASLANGYEMKVTIADGAKREATMAICREGETLFETSYEWSPDEDDYDCLEELTDDMIDFIYGVEEDQAWLYNAGYIEPQPDSKPQEQLSLVDAEACIREAGYQTESIHITGGYAPILFVVENEVVLIGSKHFSENNVFVEVKRLDWQWEAAKMERVDRLREDIEEIAVIKWQDGSLGFRWEFSPWTRKDNFHRELASRIAIIRSLLAKIEEREFCREDVCYELSRMRQLFIYEVMDASLQLSRIQI